MSRVKGRRGRETSSHVFVTGMPRSGTTLLDKLLSSHPRIHVLSQPLPLLYVRVKQAFLGARGQVSDLDTVPRPYPLNDMFGVNYYRPADFLAFLHTYRLSHEFCRTLLEDMVPFDGQYTKPEDPFRALSGGVDAASMWDFVSRYVEFAVDTADLAVTGSKEAFCEEYIPYYLARGARVVQILRDPRDVLTSLDHGRGVRYGGPVKPLLFNLRQWRKSVAFALAHEADPGFLLIRYEDLVRDPGGVAARMTDFLALDRFAPELLASDLRSQSGGLWRSNSSHAERSRITTDSVSLYRRHLAREMDLFVQAVCFTEMKCLDYEVEIGEHEVSPILDRYRDDGPAARPGLAFYVWSRVRQAEEQIRWQRLRGCAFEPAMFVFEEAFLRLCQVTAG